MALCGQLTCEYDGLLWPWRGLKAFGYWLFVWLFRDVARTASVDMAEIACETRTGTDAVIS